MKRTQLVQALTRVHDFNTPRRELEQYPTPPEVAAAMLLEAHRRGQIKGRGVVDLGCGTGRLAIGAALLGAASVEGVEVDEVALSQARRAATSAGVADLCTFTLAEVSRWRGSGDTVVMNPPFGSQHRRADRPFMERALRAAPHLHSLHLAVSETYWRERLTRRGHQVSTVQSFLVQLPYTFPHQTRESSPIEMVHLYLRVNR